LSSERQSETLTLSKRREEQTTVEGQLVQAKCSEAETIAARLLDDLSVRQLWGPVQAGEELLSIFKRRSLLEVKVLNRDIGLFVGRKPRSKWRLSRFKNWHY